jgi:hypothetical protein
MDFLTIPSMTKLGSNDTDRLLPFPLTSPKMLANISRYCNAHVGIGQKEHAT